MQKNIYGTIIFNHNYASLIVTKKINEANFITIYNETINLKVNDFKKFLFSSINSIFNKTNIHIKNFVVVTTNKKGFFKKKMETKTFKDNQNYLKIIQNEDKIKVIDANTLLISSHPILYQIKVEKESKNYFNPPSLTNFKKCKIFFLKTFYDKNFYHKIKQSINSLNFKMSKIILFEEAITNGILDNHKMKIGHIIFHFGKEYSFIAFSKNCCYAIEKNYDISYHKLLRTISKLNKMNHNTANQEIQSLTKISNDSKNHKIIEKFYQAIHDWIIKSMQKHKLNEKNLWIHNNYLKIYNDQKFIQKFFSSFTIIFNDEDINKLAVKGIFNYYERKSIALGKIFKEKQFTQNNITNKYSIFNENKENPFKYLWHKIINYVKLLFVKIKGMNGVKKWLKKG